MKKPLSFLPLLLLSLPVFILCSGQLEPQQSPETSQGLTSATLGATCNTRAGSPLWSVPYLYNYTVDYGPEIGKYVDHVFEDSRGSLWFATREQGLVCYTKGSIAYFSAANGLAGNRVSDITEDRAGNLWFATTDGVSKYDGTQFTNFTAAEGLWDDCAWTVMADRKGNIWVGTVKGVSCFNGYHFTNFYIPDPEVQAFPPKSNTGPVTDITEDKNGNIWFARDGMGVCKFDGKTFVYYTRAGEGC